MTIAAAVEVARTYLTEMFPEFERDTMQLEEIETPPDGKTWSFTFSVFLPPAQGDSLADLLRGRRLTKAVEVDRADGSLLSVRNKAA